MAASKAVIHFHDPLDSALSITVLHIISRVCIYLSDRNHSFSLDSNGPDYCLVLAVIVTIPSLKLKGHFKPFFFPLEVDENVDGNW